MIRLYFCVFFKLKNGKKKSKIAKLEKNVDIVFNSSDKQYSGSLFYFTLMIQSTRKQNSVDIYITE